MRQYTFRLSLGRDEIMLMYQGQVNRLVGIYSPGRG